MTISSAKWLAALTLAAPPPALAAAHTAALDEAILTDLLEQYATYSATSSTVCAAPEGSTTFTFDFPGTRTESNWYAPFVQYEAGLFQAEMSHTDANGRSWSIRIGTGGNMYSHYTPDQWGETMPPQAHSTAPWVDEVQQTVSVNQAYNKNPTYTQFCTAAPTSTPPPPEDDYCKSNFIHQAGTYMRDDPTLRAQGLAKADGTPYTTPPFFAPSLAKHCAGNSCLFASWGTHAHVPTPFTSPIMYINRYTNCGNGILEHTQMIHNFADPSNPTNNPNFARDTDHTYFNVGWGGVKTGALPVALEPGAKGLYADTSTLSYADPATTDHLEVCGWGQDAHRSNPGLSDSEPPQWAGQRTDLSYLGGYTAFVTEGLATLLPPIDLPCRKPGADCSTDLTGCLVSSCTNTEVSEGGYVRYALKVAASTTVSCGTHSAGNGEGYYGLWCVITDAGFGRMSPHLSSLPCAPGAELSFVKNTANGPEVLAVPYISHWSWNNDGKVYFSVYGSSATAAQTAATAFFDNTNGSSELQIQVQGARLGAEPYSPADLNAFTFIYGKGEDYAAVEGKSRRRLGTAHHSRNYTVFTVNWWAGSRLQAGSTYTNRGFYTNTNLGSVEATAESLLPEVAIDEISLEQWTPRAIDVWLSSTGSHIDVVPAASVEGTSTSCAGTATKACSGTSTPSAGKVPFFYVTCGSSTYFGPDPYHFAPGSGTNFNFPAHGSITNIVRAYVCDANNPATRPTWKLMGFFNPTDTGCINVSSKTYDGSFVCEATPPPTVSPTKQPSTSPTSSPSTSPTSSPTTSSPSASPTAKPTSPPTPSPTPNPSASPTAKPTLSAETIKEVLDNASVSSGDEEVTITVEGEVEINGVDCGTDPNDTNFQASLCNQLCASANVGSLVCSCTISKIVLDCSRRLQGRRLSTTGDVAIDFVLDIVAYCNDAGGCDTDEITEIAQAVYQTTDSNLADAFASDGGDSAFIADLKDEVAQSVELSTAFAAAVVDSQSFSADTNIEEIVTAALAIFREWYPAWSGNKHTCLNDGSAPLYMKLLGTYYEQSLTDCCERYFHYDFTGCMGTQIILSGFFPGWGKHKTQCLNATEDSTNVPGYMQNNPEAWLYEDIESCCEKYYNWAYNECVAKSGGTSATSTGKWYVVHQDEICKRDCPKDDATVTCGGHAKTWDELYDTALDCCEDKLHWLPSSACEAKSLNQPGTTPVGTSRWFVDYSRDKCVMDCEDSSSEPQCGGLANTWDELYDDESACCDRLWWVERDECTV